MAHGVEARAPMLNVRVAEFGLSLPAVHRLRGRVAKLALRRLCARHFGQAYADAPKRGFSIPVHAWLRAAGRPLMLELLDPSRVGALGVLDADRIAQVTRRHLDGEPFGLELWGLMVLVAWYEQRVATAPDARSLPDPHLVAVTAT
jgi:asparagine synthase (glutamine-hydrolysing)